MHFIIDYWLFKLKFAKLETLYMVGEAEICLYRVKLHLYIVWSSHSCSMFAMPFAPPVESVKETTI